MPEENSTPPVQSLVLKRSDDFVSRYANHVRFEPTVFDLKILFGQSDLSNSPPETIFQHTAMTLPWPNIKLALYYLTVQLLYQELENGKVRVPPSQIPVELPPLPPGLAENPTAIALYEVIKKVREDFIATMEQV